MGLDMYLRGEKFIWTNWEDRTKNPMEDGFKIHSKHLELGYWRKHPNLHGYIVQEFAEGEDNCQRIDLDSADLEKIILAVIGESLPETSGFFFGKSYGTQEERDEDLKILREALAWSNTEEKGVSRSVYYKASW